MDDLELSEFLDAYDTHRIQDQEHYYAERLREYVAADRQAGGFAGGLLFLAGVSGVAAAAWPAYALWLGVLATAFAATATLLGGWAELIGFSKNSRLFLTAGDSLAYARPRRPRGSDVPDSEARAYVALIEDILLGEVRSWDKEWGHADDEAPRSE